MHLLAKKIVELRILVGYLGEKHQFHWWETEFYGQAALIFLEPIFNRSLFIAQYRGVTEAAARLHDETIGVGCIYHLFRLPIGLEQASSDAFNDAKFVQAVQARLADRELALTRLSELAEKAESVSQGPLLIGQMSQDLSAELQRAAGLYCAAFTSGIQTLPYLREAQ